MGEKIGSVTKFYAGKSIFITGASGFMGKVLLEKLLYSCSDLRQIFVLMREKKGQNGTDRVKEFANLPLFQRIVNEKVEVLEKLVPVYGDISKINFGLTEKDLKHVVDETNIVFHMAATVNFEAPFKTAIEINIKSIQFMIEIAKNMPKLMAFIHTSTTFCCVDQDVLEEKVYDWEMDPKKLIDCTEWMTEEAMDIMGRKLIKPHPNTYTYTKRIAELLVRDEYPNLPIGIVRPSIVFPIYKEPLAGWVDNLNGPMGVVLGAGKGVIRSMLVNGEAFAEAVPVDFAINSMIIIAWNFATMKKKPSTVPVWNVTSHEQHRFTWRSLLDEGRKIIKDFPLEAGIWNPGGDITQNKAVHYSRVFFTQWIPAVIVDAICTLVGRKRFLVKLQQKIKIGINALHYFSLRKWDFQVAKTREIWNQMTLEESEIFYIDVEKPDISGYVKDCILGGRQFCLKEPLSTLPKARAQAKILRVLDLLMKSFWIYVLGWCLFELLR